MFKNSGSEPEFLNILKCDLAESVSTGFQLIVMIFLMIKHLKIGIWVTFLGLLNSQKRIFSTIKKTVDCKSPIVLSDL
jgi:hypothetical protein